VRLRELSVQLVENFCTERNDAIRNVDIPERYYDWLEGAARRRSQAKKKKKRENLPKFTDDITNEEEEQAIWIMGRIHAIHSEWFAASSALATPGAEGGDENAALEKSEKKERAIIDSIVYALCFMKGDTFEPEFVKRYRKDVVSSEAVRENLYRIMDEDTEWERMIEARSKI